MGDSTGGARVIETAHGQMFDPLDPSPGSIHGGDIAHALARMCRYNGHCLRFYSVAEHSILTARLLRSLGHPRQTCFDGLMHDSSEAYVPDLASPLKYNTQLGVEFQKAEDRLMRVIADRFGFRWPVSEAVANADEELLWCEASVLMPSGGKTWAGYKEDAALPHPHYRDAITDMIRAGMGGVEDVAREFMREFKELRPHSVPHQAFAWSPAGGV